MFRKKSQKSCFQFHEVVISSSILIPEEGFQVKYRIDWAEYLQFFAILPMKTLKVIRAELVKVQTLVLW